MSKIIRKKEDRKFPQCQFCNKNEGIGIIGQGHWICHICAIKKFTVKEHEMTPQVIRWQSEICEPLNNNT